mgnify:CR=1 FL=1
MKQIIKNFNTLVKKTIFKVQNKTNNNFNISIFNKYLITFIASLFIYLFYLLIPLLYDKTWVQTNIQSQLLNKFKINLNISDEILYHILPAPHFLIKDSQILVADSDKKKSIAQIKDLKVYLSKKNLFEKEKVDITKIVINDANFSISSNDLKLFNEFKKKIFSHNEINIINSNVFFKDNLGEIISIIRINDASLFFDIKKFLNFLNLKGEVFNMPFTFNLMHHNKPIEYEKIYLNFKSLKLDILNEFTIDKNKLLTGENSISFLNSKVNTKYNIKEKLIIFESTNSKLNNSNVSYAGEMSINPFDLNLNIKFNDYKISKLFNISSIFTEFVKSELLFNDNISVTTSIDIDSTTKNEFFQNANINFNIINGKINFNNTRLVNNKIGSLELNNSNLYVNKDNKLVLNTNILIDIKDPDRLFSFLNTNKKMRKNIKNIFINLDYNFLNNQIKFNNIKMDNQEFNDRSLVIINDNSFKNWNKSRQLLNEIFSIYEG